MEANELIRGLIKSGVVTAEHLDESTRELYTAELSEAEQTPEPSPEEGKLVRGTNGRFLSKGGSEDAIAKTKSFSRDARAKLQNVLMSNPAVPQTPTTRLEAAALNIIEVAATAGADNLSGAAKGFSEVAKWSGLDSAETELQTPIRVVIITNPDVPIGVGHERYVKPTRPAWIEAEVISQDAPVRKDNVDGPEVETVVEPEVERIAEPTVDGMYSGPTATRRQWKR